MPGLRLTVAAVAALLLCSIAGAAPVTIRGSGFTADIAVRLDDAPVPFVRDGNQRLTFVAPPHVNGYAPLTLETYLGRGAAELFYVPPALDLLPPGFITTVA